MKYFVVCMFAFFSMKSSAQVIKNFSDWSDSVTLSGWENKNFVRVDTVNYNGYKLYSQSHAHFASVQTHDSTVGQLTGRFAIDFNPRQMIVVATGRSNVINRFKISMRVLDGADTIGTISYTSVPFGMQPDFDQVTNTITWKQHVHVIDTQSYWLGRTADSIVLSLGLLKYSGSMNDTTDFWIDEIILLDHYTGLEESKGPALLKVFPNPCKETAMVDVNCTEAGRAFYRVYDMQGRLCMTESFEALHGHNSIPVNTQTLENGLYFFQLTTESGTLSVKIQVLH